MLRRNRPRGATPRRNNNNGHSGNGRPQGSGVYERPESRPRHGVASQNYERYMNQAKDALSSGDRVQAEFYYQHADHYLRILNEYREQQRVQQAHQQEAQAEKESAQGRSDNHHKAGPAENSGEKHPKAEHVDEKNTPNSDNAEPETVKAPPRRQPRKPRPKNDAAAVTSTEE